MTQLTIDFGTQASFRSEDFVITPCNRVAHEWMMRWPDWPAQCLWLCGPASSGKTHLLHLWAARSNARIATDRTPDTNPIAAFGDSSALAIDHLSLSSTADEETLFHLLNHAAHAKKWLLITHEQPPARLAVSLPDLRSRLNALPVAMLEAPDDTLLHALMIKQLADRQLSIDPDVVHYLLTRCERSCDAIARLVNRLDEASMQQKRRITLPFARQLLTDHV